MDQIKYDSGRRERKKIMLRNQIVQTTLELIESVGYQGASVEEVVRRIDISQPTFYNYFSSKDDVLRAAVCDRLKLWNDALEVRAQGGESLSDLLAWIHQELARQNADLQAVWPAIALANPLFPARTESQQALEASLKLNLGQIVQQAQERGEIGRTFSSEALAGWLYTLQLMALLQSGGSTEQLTADLAEVTRFVLAGAR